jgi:hypothetical protein
MCGVKKLVVIPLLFFAASVVYAQDLGDARVEPASVRDSVNLLGVTLEELFRDYAVPKTVGVARGAETWADDVVFAYNNVELYLVKNVVWQAAVREYGDIKVGDNRSTVLLVLGAKAIDSGDYIETRIIDRAWPVTLRYNIENGKVSSIYIYRSDY